jgi:hypothetical protein
MMRAKEIELDLASDIVSMAEEIAGVISANAASALAAEPA